MLEGKVRLIFTKLLINLRRSHSWTLPIGHNTSINVYNCVSKQKEPLIIKNKNVVTWYTCGPTVYDVSHVGHGCCYVKLDIIQRILKQHFGLNLVTCMNITDIDDKIIKKAHEMKSEISDVARKYEKDFWRDLSDLNIPSPDIVLRVTENVPLIVEFIKKLESNGFAYKAADNSVYFDVTKSLYPPGKLQNITDGVEQSPNPYKKSPADFALWKSMKTKTEPFFESPWGKGRPGWHIECSTLASHVFGSTIDIHAGGLDLRFPHHENEEIQSCAFHRNCQWVNYWIHTGNLHLKDSVKMSKSLKNTVSIQEMFKTTDAQVFRLACAMSHYFSPMEYTTELLATSQNVLNVYRNFFVTCLEVKTGFLNPCFNNDILRELLVLSVNEIHTAFCDDFNTPRVIEVINKIISTVNSMIHSTRSTKPINDLYYFLALCNVVSKTLNMFGVELSDCRNKLQNEDFTDFINMLVNFRQEVRHVGLREKNKDILKLCDSLRDSLKKQSNLNIKDHGNRSSWNS